MRHVLAVMVASAGLLASSTASANAWDGKVKYPGAVAAFNSACLRGELTASAREAAISREGWEPTDLAGLNIAAFNITAALEKNFDFSRPDYVKAWTKVIDGQSATVVLVSYPEKRRYQTLCSVLMPDAGGALGYEDELDADFKAIQVKSKSTDLPHYFEWASKVGPEKNPVRGEILTRSQVLRGTRDMHLYVAF